MTIPDHARWKYLLSADGFTASCRLGKLMGTNSVVLKVGHKGGLVEGGAGAGGWVGGMRKAVAMGVAAGELRRGRRVSGCSCAACGGC